jgi:hypothetical protein
MKIEWTLASKNDYWQNIEYLENHWSEKEVLNFINEIDYSINLLTKGNVIFTKSDYPNVYKMVIIKQKPFIILLKTKPFTCYDFGITIKI